MIDLTWLLHWTGGDNVSGPIYGEWSGFLSVALPPLFTVIGMYIMYRYHNQCHVHGCVRFGKHPYHHYKLCNRHHPDVPQKVTLNHIVAIKHKR